MLYLHLNPEIGTLARRRESDIDPGPPWVQMTEEEFALWLAAQPAPPIPNLPLPFCTAIEHLYNIGLGSDYQPTLIYLRMSLTAANKTCAELDALELYLRGILAIYAQDQGSRNDWALPPYTFATVVVAAMTELSS
jgi:hypothetical protein